MKKWILIGCLFAVVFILGAGELQRTINAPYSLMRTEAVEDADANDLTTTKQDFSLKPSGAIRILGKEYETGQSTANCMQIIFCGGSAADKTFGFRVYAWRNENGPIELVCTGTGILGTQTVVKYPHSGSTATSKYWADTLSVTNYWIGDGALVYDSGNNHISRLCFDLFGYRWIFVQIINADGSTGTEAGNISVYYSYF